VAHIYLYGNSYRTKYVLCTTPTRGCACSPWPLGCSLSEATNDPQAHNISIYTLTDRQAHTSPPPQCTPAKTHHYPFLPYDVRYSQTAINIAAAAQFAR
jgi:hypothetical protein